MKSVVADLTWEHTKILVSLLLPVGCALVNSSIFLYNNCSDPLNKISRNHNTRLLQVVEDLNKEIGKPVVRTLDIYNSLPSYIN
ncbi:hypothetical protein Lal_00047684 [Lupinus albus]|nr:hypothetical protein Lal_00047684 [Lupinus albus]